MRVELQNTNQNVDMDKNTYRIPNQEDDARIAEMMTGYSLDITGNVTDNIAFEDNGLKSVEDVKLSAGALDVTTQRNYMAVMSNSMSTEDFAQLMEEGYHPGEIATGDMVTNLDKIKAKMAESGTVIAGYNDDLSSEEISQITGDPVLSGEITDSLHEKTLPVTEDNVKEIKEALDKTEQIGSITDGMVKYLVNNDMEPTIDNLYKAEFSSSENTHRQQKGYYRDGNGYYSKKAEEVDWDNLKDAADKIISEADLSDEPNVTDDAKWMIEQGLPLTKETLGRVYDIRHIVLPKDSSDIIDAITDTIAEGKRPGQTNLSQKSEISLKRFTEETRLSMSIKANRALMRQGLKIETEDLMRAVELLKDAERELFGQAVDIIQEVANQPAESIGRATFEIPRFTLKDLFDIGQPIKQLYEESNEAAIEPANNEIANNEISNKEIVGKEFAQAVSRYETVWTVPRSDLGDSIKKAFRNVDDILIDMDYELDEINRKSVRILGYTETEINKENFERVREATKAVLEVIENMTPEKTLEMIRDGFNPLAESVSDVASYLKSKKDSDKAESYSEYIWKLDKNKEVTESEKEAYIGIYRLIRQIEKNDGRPIGDVLSSDEELTLQNLLSAVRSRKGIGMDFSIDDAFGTLDTLTRKDTSISDQILQAFDKVLQTAESKEAEMELAKEMRMDASQAQQVSDSVIDTLLGAGEAVTTDNLIAMDYLMHMRGHTFGNLKKVIDKSDSKDKEALNDKINKIKDVLDSEDRDDNYQSVIKEAVEFVDNEMYSSGDSVEVRELRLLNKQLSLAGRMVKNDRYEVPVEIDGKMSSVNLQIIRNTGDCSCRITFSSEKYGNVDARFSVVSDELKGYVLSDSEVGKNFLEKGKDKLERLSGYSDLKIDYLVNDTVKIDDYISSGEGTSLKELYAISKAFLNTL